jgi:hypothetical protein
LAGNGFFDYALNQKGCGKDTYWDCRFLLFTYLGLKFKKLFYLPLNPDNFLLKLQQKG